MGAGRGVELPNCSFSVPNWKVGGDGTRGAPKTDFGGGVPNTEAAVGNGSCAGAGGADVSITWD